MRWVDVYVCVPYNIPPMMVPAKVAFSPKYRSYGIWGAFGLVDHGSSEESDMTQRCTEGGEGISSEGGEGGEGKRPRGSVGRREGRSGQREI